MWEMEAAPLETDSVPALVEELGTNVTDLAALFKDFETTNKSRASIVHRAKGERGVFAGTRNIRRVQPALAFATIDGAMRASAKRKGIRDEKGQLDHYENVLGQSIEQRNQQVRKMTVQIGARVLTVHGRVDGITADGTIIVEHKRRVRGLLDRVPFHELVQCYLYMQLYAIPTVHLLQSFGEHTRVNEIFFSEATWRHIVDRLTVKMK